MTPLASLLVEAWAHQHKSPRIIVDSSVGSTGGVHAAADGAVDLGLVARDLRDDERQMGLAVIPVARDAVVIAAHPSVMIDDVSGSDLVAFFSGSGTRWPDGSFATVFLRDRGDSGHAAIELLVPELRDVRLEAYGSHRFRVLLHDDAMGEALTSTPGSIGVFSFGAVVTGRMPLRVLAISGVRPSLSTMQDGTWKATRVLSFVARPDRIREATDFLSFVAGPEGNSVARSGGYLPVGPIAP